MKMKQRGFTLLEVMFALMIAGVLVGVGAQQLESYANGIKDEATSEQLKVVIKAAANYVKANRSTIVASATSTAPYTFGVPEMMSANLLPQGFSSTNPYGQTYTVQVLQPTPNDLQAMVITTGGVAIPSYRTPKVAASAGAAGGYVPVEAPTTAQGAYGGWTVSLANYTNPGADHLAALLYFEDGNLSNDYLYRHNTGDPTLNTMYTDLNMGNNNINNANTVSAQTVSVPGGANNKVFQAGAGLFYGDSLNTAVRQDGGFFVQHKDGTSANINQVQDIVSQGRLGNMGYDPIAGLPAGYAGGVHTWDLYAEGTIMAGANGNIAAWINRNGDVGAQTLTMPAGNSLKIGNSIYYGDGLNSSIRQDGSTYIQNLAGTGFANLLANDVYIASIGKWASQVGNISLAGYYYLPGSAVGTWYVGRFRACAMTGYGNWGNDYAVIYPNGGPYADGTYDWYVNGQGGQRNAAEFRCYN